MDRTNTSIKGYVVAAVVGAVGGGLVVALATRAIPRTISQIMAALMRNWMAEMGESGCNPADI